MTDENNKPTKNITGMVNATLGPAVVTMPTDSQGYRFVARELRKGITILRNEPTSVALSFLCAHTTEVLLKAYLCRDGAHKTINEMRNGPIRHNLNALWSRAVAHGLKWAELDPPAWLDLLSNLHNNPFYLRYASGFHGLVLPGPDPMVDDLETLTSIIDTPPAA